MASHARSHQLRLGSVPMARMASTCSVTSMEPSSEAMPEALRPATSSPVMAGPSSRTRASETTSPVARSRRSARTARRLQHHHGADEKAGQ